MTKPKTNGSLRSLSRVEKGLGVSVLAVLLLRVVLIVRGWPEQGLVTDDAYYYFTIAHNIAHGLGPTFDGLNPTNGFHPLWQALLAPVFAYDYSDAWVPVRLGLVLSLAIDVISGAVIFAGLRAAAGRAAALTGVALWFLSPLVFAMGLQGMEASVHALCFALLWRYLVISELGIASPGLRNYALAGALIGLVGWARSDAPVLIGPAFCIAIIAVRDERLGSCVTRLRGLAVSGATAMAVMLPWWMWNQIQFGSPVSVAGRMKFRNPKIWGALPGQWDTVPDALYSGAYALFASALDPIATITKSTIHGARFHVWFALPLVLSVLLIIVLGDRARRRAGSSFRVGRAFLMVYLLLHVVFYGAIWRTYGGWYAAPVFVSITILLAAAARNLLAEGAGRGVRSAFGLLVATGAVLWVAMFVRVEGSPRSDEAQRRGLFEQLSERYPRTALVVGAWDAGVAGYVALDYPYLVLVNLDGLVNNQVQQAVREGRYLEYLTDHVDVFLQDRGRARMYLSPAEVKQLRRHGSN